MSTEVQGQCHSLQSPDFASEVAADCQRTHSITATGRAHRHTGYSDAGSAAAVVLGSAAAVVLGAVAGLGNLSGCGRLRLKFGF